MEVGYQLLEYFATFMEGFFVISVITELIGPKYLKAKGLLIILGFSTAYTVIISLMNSWEAFSFVTIAVAIVFTFLISFITAKGSLLLRATSVIVAWFFVHTIDYLLSYALIMIMGGSIDLSKGIPLILSPGIHRTVYLILDKLTELVVFVLFRRLYKNFRLLSNKGHLLILILASVSYILMSVITSFILSDSVLILQTTVILSLMFILLSLVITIFAVALNNRYQKKQLESETIGTINQMTEKNFENYKRSQGIIQTQVHDFQNHLRVISEMAGDNADVSAYIDALLNESKRRANKCNSGNQTIDTVINYKAEEAERDHIPFSFNVDCSQDINISSVDICSVLANQIDNALEASEKEPADSRFVSVEIKQQLNMIFFKVSNYVSEDPFINNPMLQTTKNKDSGSHGLGINSIELVVEKYKGISNFSCQNNIFTSQVMLINAI